MNVTNKELVDNLLPSLQAVHDFSLPNAKVKDLMTLAENLAVCELKAKDFWKTRESILQKYAEKGENGDRIEVENEKGEKSYKITSAVKFGKDFQELLETMVEVSLGKVDVTIFEDVDGLKPMHIKGLLEIINK